MAFHRRLCPWSQDIDYEINCLAKHNSYYDYAGQRLPLRAEVGGRRL
jgi:hypothetical protein